MQLKSNNAGNLTAAFILLSGISTLGLFISREQTAMLFLAYFSAFLGYFWIAYLNTGFSFSFTTGLFARLILFFGLPTLSDDVFRFLWDGFALAEGINPYGHTPDQLLDHNNTSLGPKLYNLLNSQDKYTVYPPLNQYIFWVAAKISNGNLLFGTNILRIFLLAADIGSFVLLRKLLRQREQKVSLANWYWLNPLVILEFTGNLHFEGIVIFFLIAGLYWVGKPVKAGIMFGMAVATKLLPLIFLPALFFRYRWQKGLTIAGMALAVLCISVLPFLGSDLFSGVGSSLLLYFNKFEFNASIYYFARWVGFLKSGYNMISTIGPFLSLIALLTIFEIALHGRWRGWSLEVILLLTLSVYLFLSTTVHPWYILPLIIFGLLSGYYFPIVWSFMIVVSYFGYTENGYELSMGWVILEYLVVFAFAGWEILKQYKIEEHQH